MLRNTGQKLLLSLLAALMAVPCARAAPPGISELFRTTPPPPASTAMAGLWVQDGRVSAAEVVQLEATLKDARSRALADAATAPDAKGTGAPGEMPAVKLAVDGYQAYRAANEGATSPAAVLGSRVQWLAKRFSGVRKRVEGTDRAPEVREQELAAYRALFTDWQSQRAPIVAKAQAELAAVGDPALIRSPADRTAVERYRIAMIDEVEVLLGLTRYAVERVTGLPTAEPASVTPSANTLWDLMSDRREKPPR
ncbi:MAG: hypothetical protein ACREUE_08930 [Panacagrimonas sp.]